MYDFEQYIEDVLNNKIVTSSWVKKAVQRHLEDIEKSKEKKIWFNREAAQWACKIFPTLLRHTDGTPFELYPWQQFIVAMIFGWMLEGTDVRRFRRVYIEMARKNGKTTLLAGIAIIMFLLDGEPDAKVFAAATKRDQAKLMYEAAKKMLLKSPDLQRIVTFYHSSMTSKNGSTFIPLSAEANTLDGLSISCAVIDELHAHPTSALFDVLDTSTGARTQPLICMITTAGTNQQGICFELRTMVCEILNKNVQNESWFGFICGLDEEDPFTDETLW